MIVDGHLSFWSKWYAVLLRFHEGQEYMLIDLMEVSYSQITYTFNYKYWCRWSLSLNHQSSQQLIRVKSLPNFKDDKCRIPPAPSFQVQGNANMVASSGDLRTLAPVRRDSTGMELQLCMKAADIDGVLDEGKFMRLWERRRTGGGPVLVAEAGVRDVRDRG